MINKLSNSFIIIQLCLLVLTAVAIDYSALVVLEVILVLILALNKLGNGIILRELISFHTALVLLFVPLMGYKFYTIDNPLSKTWVKYMPIDEISYFQFVLPAVIIFNLLLCWPISSKQCQDEGILFQLRLKKSLEILNSSKINPKLFIILGTLMYFLQRYLPVDFQYVGYLFFTSSFVGFLMLYLNPLEIYRIFFITYFVLFLFYVSILSSMFTVVVYMGMTVSSFIFIGSKISFWRKILMVIIVSSFLFTLQNLKIVLRNSSLSNTNGLTLDFYLNQMSTQVSENEIDFFNPDYFFISYTRANQGFLVAKVIKYFPNVKEFDNGTYLGQAIFSALVPRILWPDKPKAGGRFTFEYFTGDKLVGNTSMNVSPLGEAYGSFGPGLGILYMALLALFIRGVYRWFISLTYTIPFLIFWFPVVFYQLTYSMETDSLQIFNSLFKSGTFVFILYIISPSLFGIKRKSFLSVNN